MNAISSDVYRNFVPLPPDLGGWGGDDPLLAEIVRERRPRIAVEVGTWKGQSAVAIAKAMLEVSPSPKLYCIDTWLGSTEFWTTLSATPERDLMLRNGYPQVYHQFLSNVMHSRLTDVIVPVPNTSLNGIRILRHLEIRPDLVYLDASHEYEDVLADLHACHGLLKGQGAIVGDDHGWEGVRRALDEFSEKISTPYYTRGRFWVIEPTPNSLDISALPADK